MVVLTSQGCWKDEMCSTVLALMLEKNDKEKLSRKLDWKRVHRREKAR